MKKALVILLVLAALASVAGCILGATALRVFAGNSLRGSGKIVSKTMPVPDFDAIDASRAVKVILVDAATAMTIEADDNLIDLVKVETKGGTLEVGIDNTVKSISHCSVTVTVPVNGKISRLHASSASKIIGKTTLEADKLTIDASSAAKIEVDANAGSCSIDASSASHVEAKLDVESCTINLSSAAKVELSGKAGKCRADMSSASKLDAEGFLVTDYTIGTSSAAKASIACTGKLRANASSGSSIRYWGDCEVHADKSSGGSIRKK